MRCIDPSRPGANPEHVGHFASGECGRPPTPLCGPWLPGAPQAARIAQRDAVRVGRRVGASEVREQHLHDAPARLTDLEEEDDKAGGSDEREG